MKVPSRKEFDRFVAERYTWRAMDQGLYFLCSMKPSEEIGSWDIVYSSALTIGLTYRAFIGRGWAVEPVARALADWSGPAFGNWTQEQIRQVPAGPWLTREGLQSSIKVHCRVCTRLREHLAEKDREAFNPEVFVSKWLHFHAPGVPILDANSEDALSKMDLSPQEIRLDAAEDEPIIERYKKHCERLWAFSELLGKPQASVRYLDVFLYEKGREKKNGPSAS